MAPGGDSSTSSRSSSSDSVSSIERPSRPRITNRAQSSTFVIPKSQYIPKRLSQNSLPTTPHRVYPPGDARSMSPRRSSQETEKLEENVRVQREAMESQARTLQSSLQALESRINDVKKDSEQLERDNRMLQEYIGGLTRSMTSQAQGVGRSSSLRKGRK